MSRSFGEGSSSDHGGSSSSSKSSQIPVPLEGLSQPGPPPFLTKTYDIVETQSSNHIISWSSGNNSFVIWDPQTFALTLLPSYFKHNNFSSFVRQLNSYGFRKVDPERWEFANEGFLRGQRNLLSKIRRRGTSGTSPTPSILSQTSIDSCVEVGLFGSLDKEIDRLKRDKKMLMMELFKIREQHQSNRTYLESMEQRLRGTEMKQKQLMGFLARAVSNPNFMQQLIQQREVRKHNLLLQGSSDVSQMVTESDQYVNFQIPHQNPGMNMQSNSSNPDGKMPHMAGHEQERALDRLFWEEFLDENTEEDFSLMGAEGDEGQDVENLFDQFGDLG